MYTAVVVSTIALLYEYATISAAKELTFLLTLLNLSFPLLYVICHKLMKPNETAADIVNHRLVINLVKSMKVFQ